MSAIFVFLLSSLTSCFCVHTGEGTRVQPGPSTPFCNSSEDEEERVQAGGTEHMRVNTEGPATTRFSSRVSSRGSEDQDMSSVCNEDSSSSSSSSMRSSPYLRQPDWLPSPAAPFDPQSTQHPSSSSPWQHAWLQLQQQLHLPQYGNEGLEHTPGWQPGTHQPSMVQQPPLSFPAHSLLDSLMQDPQEQQANSALSTDPPASHYTPPVPGSHCGNTTVPYTAQQASQQQQEHQQQLQQLQGGLRRIMGGGHDGDDENGSEGEDEEEESSGEGIGISAATAELHASLPPHLNPHNNAPGSLSSLQHLRPLHQQNQPHINSHTSRLSSGIGGWSMGGAGVGYGALNHAYHTSLASLALQDSTPPSHPLLHHRHHNMHSNHLQQHSSNNAPPSSLPMPPQLSLGHPHHTLDHTNHHHSQHRAQLSEGPGSHSDESELTDSSRSNSSSSSDDDDDGCGSSAHSSAVGDSSSSRSSRSHRRSDGSVGSRGESWLLLVTKWSAEKGECCRIKRWGDCACVSLLFLRFTQHVRMYRAQKITPALSQSQHHTTIYPSTTNHSH